MMLFCMAALVLGATEGRIPPEDIAVVPLIEDYEPEQLFRYLMRIAEAQYAERDALLDRLTTSEQWRARQEYVRRTVVQMVGGFPERTPLNARAVGALEYDDYRIEKVIYESRPEFFVTANVYVPKRGEPPFPALLSPCGHSSNGKAYETYQRAYIAAAKQGYIVLAYDPISQGERLQILGDDGRPLVGVGTQEHSHQGNQGYLIGVNLAQIRIWDGIRSLDYLVSREDVDPERIGVMGNSGGGTLTTYLCAVEPRLAAASPNCYVTTLLRRFYSRVAADAEQNLLPQIARGIDHADMLSVMAPRPVQIGAAVRDFFPIEGTREAFKALQRVYGAFDALDAVALVEDDVPHNFSQVLREGMVRWMNRWLRQPAPDYAEPSINVEAEERLLCTETGQVLTSLGGRTVFDLYRDMALERIPQRPTLRTAEDGRHYRERTVRAAQEVLAWERPNGPMNARVFDGRADDGVYIERVVFDSEQGIRVPALVVSPAGADGRLPATVYVHEDGKAAGLEDAIALAREGRRVIAIDPRGMGETRSPTGRPEQYYARHGVETDMTHTSFLIGRPMLGLRVRDVVRAVDYAVSRPDVDGARVSLYGVRMGGLLVLHAALLDERVESVAVRETLLSYKALVLNELYDYHVNAVIPGVIGRYDLGDVVAAIAPRAVELAHTVDERQRPASAEAVAAEYGIAREAYTALARPDALSIR